MTFTLYIKPDGKSHYFREMNMNRNSIVGCKLDKEMKKVFENECRKEHRTVSSTLLLFIEEYLNKKGKERKAD